MLNMNFDTLKSEINTFEIHHELQGEGKHCGELAKQLCEDPNSFLACEGILAE